MPFLMEEVNMQRRIFLSPFDREKVKINLTISHYLRDYGETKNSKGSISLD